MELAIPGLALGLLYVASNQNKDNEENRETFVNNDLPNTNNPNRNYPNEYPIDSSELDQTSALSQVNRFESNGV